MQRVFLAGLALVLAPAMAPAAIVIDDFSVGGGAFVPAAGAAEVFGDIVIRNDGILTTNLSGSTSPSIAAERVVSFDFGDDGNTNFPSADGSASVNSEPFTGPPYESMSYNLNGGAPLRLFFDYDFGSPEELTGGGENLGLLFRAAVQGAGPVFTPLVLTVTLFDNLGASNSVDLTFVPTNGTQLNKFAFFDEFIGVDATQATRLTATGVLDTDNQELTFDLIAATTVPEPMSLTLAGLLGVGLCGGAYRRKKQVVA